MGLDTTHNAWHGGYGRFNNFRNWLANCIGINLNDYIGYGANATKELSSIEHELEPLFNHSDCDGNLDPSDCKKIADGIDKVLNCVVKDLEPYSNYQKAIQFRDGCLDEYTKNETIEFK